jgi:hypothetical protein
MVFPEMNVTVNSTSIAPTIFILIDRQTLLRGSVPTTQPPADCQVHSGVQNIDLRVIS